MKYSLNTASDTYDEFRGQELAASTQGDEDGPTADGMFPSGQMDTVTLHSTKAAMRTHYVAGVWKETGLCVRAHALCARSPPGASHCMGTATPRCAHMRLAPLPPPPPWLTVPALYARTRAPERHLTPLKAILQMRPGFGHIDEADKRKAEKAKANDPKREADEAKPVQMQYKRIESERAAKARMRSHSHMQQQSDLEPWSTVEYRGTSSAESEAVVEQLETTEPGRTLDFTDSPAEWLTRLNLDESRAPLPPPPGQIKEEDGAAAAAPAPARPPSAVSLHMLRQLPQAEQVHTLMAQAEILQFGSIRNFVTVADESTLLSCLEGCAWLLGGAWVVMSDLVGPPEGGATDAGTPGRLFRRARDFVLLQFYHSKAITPNEVAVATGLSGEDIRLLLRRLGRLEVQADGRQRYVFLHAQDSGFVASHQKVVARQEALWRTAREPQIMQALDAVMLEADAAADAASAIFAVAQSTQTGAEQMAGALTLPAGADAAAALKHVVEQALKAHGVCSLEFFKNTVQALASLSDENLALLGTSTHAAIRQALRAVGTEELTPEHLPGEALFIFKTSPSTKKLKVPEWRMLIARLLEKHRKVKRADVKNECKEQALTEVTSGAYHSIMKEFAFNVGNHWTLKSGKGE